MPALGLVAAALPWGCPGFAQSTGGMEAGNGNGGWGTAQWRPPLWSLLGLSMLTN